MQSLTSCQCSVCCGCFQQHFTIAVRDKHIRDMVCPVCWEPDINDPEHLNSYFSTLDIQVGKLIKLTSSQQCQGIQNMEDAIGGGNKLLLWVLLNSGIMYPLIYTALQIWLGIVFNGFIQKGRNWFDLKCQWHAFQPFHTISLWRLWNSMLVEIFGHLTVYPEVRVRLRYSILCKANLFWHY